MATILYHCLLNSPWLSNLRGGVTFSYADNRVEAVIELNVSPKKSRGFDEIAATIAAFDEVESVVLMSGGYDLQLVIKGQTFQEIALFVAKRLSPLDDVLSTATHFVLRTYKKEGRLYQDEEIDERECTVL